MAAESAKEFEALEAQAATLLDTFRNAGYEQVAPAILQPADVFLDRIGEQIRSRTYVFTDLAGDELCLRPDLTVPVSRLYLERHPDGGDEARYCYNGPAFRFQPEADNRTRPREFRQAGIECFGDSDRESADVEIVLLAVEAVRRAGLKQPALRFGDIAMFYALLDAFALPERWRLKLRHYFWRPSAFHDLLTRLARGERSNGDGPALALAGALAGETQDRAEERIATYLEEKGLPLAGNRTLGEIAARLLDQSADLGAGPLEKEVAVVIDSYLAISGAPEKAIEGVATLGKEAGLDLSAPLSAFARRLARLEESGVDLARATFATEFGRNLEYYSGLVFQIESPGFDDAIAGGGRYDGLLADLGAPREVPAIGSAIHTERLLAAVREKS
jgi:ATP phosphoribosyltransferase regulatory subunit